MMDAFSKLVVDDLRKLGVSDSADLMKPDEVITRGPRVDGRVRKNVSSFESTVLMLRSLALIRRESDDDVIRGLLHYYRTGECIEIKEREVVDFGVWDDKILDKGI